MPFDLLISLSRRPSSRNYVNFVTEELKNPYKYVSGDERAPGTTFDRMCASEGLNLQNTFRFRNHHVTGIFQKRRCLEY